MWDSLGNESDGAYNKKAALESNRNSIAGRLPILFDPALAGFLSKVNALGRAPASDLLCTPEGVLLD